MSIPTHFPHQQPSPIAVSAPLTTPNSLMTSTQVLWLQILTAASPTCSTHFSQPFAHYSIITTPSSSKPINPLALLLSLPAAVRNAPASHSTFDLKLLRFATNRYHKCIAAVKSHSKPHLSSPPHPNLELFGKLSITSYTELQIAPYLHHPLWLPYYTICHIFLW